MYTVEFNGDHYQSVFPEHESEKSQLHTNKDDAWRHIVDEIVTQRDRLKRIVGRLVGWNRDLRSSNVQSVDDLKVIVEDAEKALNGDTIELYTKEERKPGYYWVFWKTEWTILRWYGGLFQYWAHPQWDEPLSDEAFKAIIEEKLPEPDHIPD